MIRLKGQQISKKRVMLVKSNSLEKETRFTKEIVTLIGNGYNVTFIGWDRERNINQKNIRDPGRSHREILFKIKAPYGLRVFLFLPFWWSFVFYQLLINKWDIVQAGEFISVPPAVLIGKLKRKPVIYEILDVYEDQIVLPSPIRAIAISIDKIFTRLVNCVILADIEETVELGGIPNDYIVEINDSPPDENKNFQANKESNSTFTIFFAGKLVKSRQLNLDKVIQACRDIEGIKIIIAGYGDQVEELTSLAAMMPEKVEFIGELTHSEVLRKSIDADLLFVLRNPIVPVNKYICGSKVLEAVMCGTPFLASKDTSTANIVKKENFGFAVDPENIDEIKSAIITLKNDAELHQQFRSNARDAYVNKYSWSIMEQRLLEIYQRLST